MSAEYDIYINDHRRNVKKGLYWLRENCPEILFDDINFGGTIDYEWQLGLAHDESKNSVEEYDAYDRYFYGGNRSYRVVSDFNKAWLHHIHHNPHHWQHWILVGDDPEFGDLMIEIPHNYVIEMICDWWSFSWKTGNLYEIFDWYNDHEDHIKFHQFTRKTVEEILDKIRGKLDELAEKSI